MAVAPGRIPRLVESPVRCHASPESVINERAEATLRQRQGPRRVALRDDTASRGVVSSKSAEEMDACRDGSCCGAKLGVWRSSGCLSNDTPVIISHRDRVRLCGIDTAP